MVLPEIEVMAAGCTEPSFTQTISSTAHGLEPGTEMPVLKHLDILELHFFLLQNDAFDYSRVLGDTPELQSQILQLFGHFSITTAGGS